MKVLLCYFSGTGNTKKVVDKYVEAFNKNDVTVDVYKIEENNFNYNIEDYDMIGFGYPVHAFNAPSIILKFAKTLPKVNTTKNVFIIKTSGEPLKLNNISSLKLTKILKRKGYKVTNEYHYVMPYNIIFRHTDNMAYKMWQAAENVVPIDCKEILDGKKSLLKRVFLGGLLAWVFRIEFWGGRFNGKRYKVNENCVHCNRCVNTCPMHNITIENGEFHFGKNCIMCMRCSFYCPRNAIKIGLFEKWKVNGAYNFNNKNDNEEDKHKKYCKKSYIKYFAKCEEKIKNAQGSVATEPSQETKDDDVEDAVNA